MRIYDQQFIQEMKSKLDVELIGVVSVEASNPKELNEKATSLLPGVKSVIVVGKEIYKEVVVLLKPSKEAGEAESGELLGVHSDYLNGRLTRAVHELATLFRQKGYRSLPLPAVAPSDQRFLTALLSYKHAAELAGLGTIGRHSLLITPAFGPRVRLACLLTEAILEPSPLNGKDYCINCDVCVRECPAQALQIPKEGEKYSINKFACRAYRQAGLTCGVCMKACDEAIG
jgi:epoxyqueuosine reductase QueG